uniref:Potassium channel domain-containing protein n=1 Tax=Strigamia maritima TaxID=126957 RepID=T1ITT6_STRMM
MLLYLTNIGDVLAKMFKYVYARLCRCAVQDSSAIRQRRHLPGEGYRARHIVAHNSPKTTNAVTGDGGACKEKLRLPPEDEVRIEAIPEAVLDDDEYETKSHVTVPITLCLLILVLYICGGGWLFSEWEEWYFLDGCYFCFVTLTTIGFGDLVPGDTISSDEDSQVKLVLCSLYVLVGMALIAMCFNLMQEEVIHKVRSCGTRIGILKDRDEDDD